MIRILHIIRKMNSIIRIVVYFAILLFMDEIIVRVNYSTFCREPPQGPLMAPGKPQQWSNKQNTSLKKLRSMVFFHCKSVV